MAGFLLEESLDWQPNGGDARGPTVDVGEGRSCIFEDGLLQRNPFWIVNKGSWGDFSSLIRIFSYVVELWLSL
uniref:Uncharacterized protein n=1 Tax=Nelumbo nucifera TaxID=4432 RepID=A0A822YTE8_NELNU|nr:TPA_asm: hypothetical protein HUJ06_005035 [Nelumbo nucifera]